MPPVNALRGNESMVGRGNVPPRWADPNRTLTQNVQQSGQEIRSELLPRLGSMAVDATPVAGEAKGIYEAASGVDPFTKEKLPMWARIAGAASGVIPLLLPVLRPSMVKMAIKKGMLSSGSEKVGDTLAALSELDRQVFDGIGKTHASGHKNMNALEIDNYLQSNPQTMQQLREIEQQAGASIIDLDGGIRKHPIERKRHPNDPTKQEFGSFMRSFSQTYLDSMDAGRRELFRTEIRDAMEDEFLNNRRGGMFEQALHNITDPDKARRNPYQNPDAHPSEDMFKGVASPLGKNMKTVGAMDLSTVCPMLNVGAHGCYLDACYVSSMGRGGSAVPFYSSAMYTAEILQMSKPTVAKMNKAGGLRINGQGDLTFDQLPQIRDILRHADMVGLKTKVISKQDDTFDIIQQLQDEGIPGAKDIVVQPTVDPYWVPVQADKIPGSGAEALQIIQAVESGRPEALHAAATAYKVVFGRAAKVINTSEGPKLMRKYGFTWSQVKELGEKYPNIKILPRVVVSTPREIAEYALNVPEALQTLMHAKVKAGIWSEVEGDWLHKHAINYVGGGISRHFVKKVKGEWTLGGQVRKGSLQMKQPKGYAETERFIKQNYSKEEADTIFQRMAGEGKSGKNSILCCKGGKSDSACLDCSSHGAMRTYFLGEELSGIAERGPRTEAIVPAIDTGSEIHTGLRGQTHGDVYSGMPPEARAQFMSPEGADTGFVKGGQFINRQQATAAMAHKFPEALPGQALSAEAINALRK